MNKEIITIVFCIFGGDMEEYLLQCNKYYVICFSHVFYPIPKYSSRIKFYISWCKKAIHRYCFLRNSLNFVTVLCKYILYYINGMITNI